MPSKLRNLSSGLGCGPATYSTVFCRKIEAPERADQHRQEGAVPQRIVDAVVEQHAEQRHRHQRADEGEPVGPAEAREEQHHRVAAQHGEIALGEVHHVGGADDQHEAQRHQRIDAAQPEAGEQDLQVFGDELHGCDSCGTTSAGPSGDAAVRRRAPSPLSS